MQKKFPARIHAVFARDKPYAVIFRRGPSKQVCTFLWDREKDSFELGQWLKGRIYERRADLSPDGKYLIYFAMNGRWDSETGGSWTAVSKAPWLKAIELYGKSDCWEGGGLFLSNNRFWINDRYFTPQRTLRQSSEVTHDQSHIPEGEFGAEDTGVYYRRLIRDGWQIVSQNEISKWNTITTFKRPVSKGWELIKIAHEQVDSPKGKGCYWNEYELINIKFDIKLKFEEWEWAELDRESIVFASKGCIYRTSIKSHSEIEKPKLLYDFNAHIFEEVDAPY